MQTTEPHNHLSSLLVRSDVKLTSSDVGGDELTCCYLSKDHVQLTSALSTERRRKHRARHDPSNDRLRVFHTYI